MNDTLIRNINDKVKEDDTLYHLGDWSFGGRENVRIFRNSIVCKNIHLLIGNHDDHINDNLSEYRDCFLSIEDTFTGYIGKTFFHLAHYSHRVWPKSHKGGIHLFGHSHGSLDKLQDLGKSMDVGVDSHPEFRPFHINEIIQIMGKKVTKPIDHHE
jgi:calcineurin-like phosphoesterase family protein